MHQLLPLLLVVTLAASSSARPRYVLIPVEDLQFAPVQQVVRKARALPRSGPRAVPIPAALEEFDQVERESAPQAERRKFSFPDQFPSSFSSFGGTDHVDYGAYTGKGGAFGWYTDHPVLVFTNKYH